MPTHTESLTYSRWERLHFKLFKTWPRSVVERRIWASDLDMRIARVRSETEAHKRKVLGDE